MPSHDAAFSLSDRVAVVTGGSRGIGFAIAHKLAAMGATVVITGRDKGHLEKAAAELGAGGQRVEGVVCDVAELASVESLGRHLQQNYGKVDILVNNAGVGGPSSLLHEMSPHDWDTLMNTNLRGVYYMMRAVVPLMMTTGAGHVINISSLAGKNPLPRGAAYSASKWGLNGLSYGVAEELREHNIRVSVICPGSVDTSFSPRRGGKDNSKMLRPDDVAHAVAMLLAQESQSFISEVLLRPTRKP